MTEEHNRPEKLIDQLKLRTPSGERSNANGKDCPACGARGTRLPGITHCVYCGYEFSDKDTEQSQD